jgi:hypothetical protein
LLYFIFAVVFDSFDGLVITLDLVGGGIFTNIKILRMGVNHGEVPGRTMIEDLNYEKEKIL